MEVWIKALLILGEQMQTTCLMLMPSYQDKMAEPSCKQHYQRYVMWQKENDKLVVLDSWVSDIRGETEREKNQSKLWRGGGKVAMYIPIKK